MRHVFLAFTMIVTASLSAANAHPGAAIITSVDGAARSAMTPGVEFEQAGSVHIFRAASADAADVTGLIGGPASEQIEINIVSPEKPWRRLRKMRTQGFYSGTPYPTRRYTHGFYSGN